MALPLQEKRKSLVDSLLYATVEMEKYPLSRLAEALFIVDASPHGEGCFDCRDCALDSHIARIDSQIVVNGVCPIGPEVFAVEGVPIRFRLVDITLRRLEVGIRIPHDVADPDLPGGGQANTEGLLRGQYKLASSADNDRVALLADGPDDFGKVTQIFIRPDVASTEHGINPDVPQSDLFFIKGGDDFLADVRPFGNLLDDFRTDEIHTQVFGQAPGDFGASTSRVPGNGDTGKGSGFLLLLLLFTLYVLPLGNLIFDDKIQGTAFHFLHKDPPP